MQPLSTSQDSLRVRATRLGGDQLHTRQASQMPSGHLDLTLVNSFISTRVEMEEIACSCPGHTRSPTPRTEPLRDRRTPSEPRVDAPLRHHDLCNSGGSR